VICSENRGKELFEKEKKKEGLGGEVGRNGKAASSEGPGKIFRSARFPSGSLSTQTQEDIKKKEKKKKGGGTTRKSVQDQFPRSCARMQAVTVASANPSY